MMKKLFLFVCLFASIVLNAQDTLYVPTKTVELDEVTVSSVLRSNTDDMQNIKTADLLKVNVGQEPSHVFKSMPSIYARGDNGTDFGYGYYYIRGLDQTRINVTLDGMPWNEAEDFGTYFANSPDLMASLHSMTVERGASSKTIGISASAGNINMESVNLKTDTVSYLQAAYGSFNTYKVSAVYNMGIKNGFGFHIRATQSHTDGFRENSWNTSRSVAAKLGYYFNDRHSIDILSINGYHRNCQGWIGSTDSVLHQNPRANGNTKEETDKWIQSVNKLSYKGWLNDNTVLMASAYLQYQTGNYRMDHDNYIAHGLGTPYDVFKENGEFDYHVEDGSWAYHKGAIFNYGLTHYLYGGNIIVKSNPNDFMDVYAGVNAYAYQRRHYMDSTIVSLKNDSVDGDEYYDNTGYKLDVSPFIGVNYNFGKFNIGANLQFRYVDFKYNSSREPYGMNPASLSSDALGTKYCFLNGGIDLNYRFNNEHDIYAKLAVSNREPMRSDLFRGSESLNLIDNDIRKLNNDTSGLMPELVHDVEIGYNLNNKYIKMNINYYFMYFKNELILSGEVSTNGLPLHTNAKSSYRTGLELTINAEPIKGLHIQNATSYGYGRVFADNVNSGFHGHHPFYPSWTLNQDICYDNISVGCANFAFGMNYNLRSSIYIDLYDEHKLPTNMSLNVYGNVLIKDRIEIGVKFNNITNRRNYSFGSVNNTNDILYVQEAGFNCLANFRYLF